MCSTIFRSKQAAKDPDVASDMALKPTKMDLDNRFIGGAETKKDDEISSCKCHEKTKNRCT